MITRFNSLPLGLKYLVCEKKIEEGEVYNGKGIKLAVVQIKFYELDTHHLHFFGFNLNSFQCYTVFILLFILF